MRAGIQGITDAEDALKKVPFHSIEWIPNHTTKTIAPLIPLVH
jgi:hypothetical protein